MKNLLSKLNSIILQPLVGWFKSGEAEKRLRQAVALVPAAMPIVEFIAALTPTRADDELISLFRQFGLPAVERWLALPVEERGRALMKAASSELARQYPGTPTRVIDLAVQLAVAAMEPKP